MYFSKVENAPATSGFDRIIREKYAEKEKESPLLAPVASLPLLALGSVSARACSWSSWAVTRLRISSLPCAI